jgi:hypothetical protein
MEFKKEDMPLSIKNFKGLIEKGLRWNDINGDNIFIFTEEPSINIDELDGEEAFGQAQFWHGYHYCNYNSGEYKLVREFKDGIGFCSEDLVFEVLTDGFFVADNNSNKIGEVIIIYKIACVGGVDPIDLKFLVFENGKKYSIKGSTIVNPGDGPMGGEVQTNESFKKEDEVLYKNSLQLFKQYQKNDNLDEEKRLKLLNN